MGGTRITGAAVERAAETLTDRDWQIVRELHRLRTATGRQLERLLFADLTGAHRDRSRRRVLSRLVTAGVLCTLDRRIGGVRAGSGGLVFVLDVLGQRLAELQQQRAEPTTRLRRPGTPTERFLAHSLAVSERYVELVEVSRERLDLTLLRFDTEPACWWQDGQGDWVKPDAVLELASDAVTDAWTLEVDRATESLPTLRRQFVRYLELLERGEVGPTGVLPRVLVTVPDSRRLTAVRGLLEQLSPVASQLIHSTTAETATRYLLSRLYE
jgi:Replication-relaxation